MVDYPAQVESLRARDSDLRRGLLAATELGYSGARIRADLVGPNVLSGEADGPTSYAREAVEELAYAMWDPQVAREQRGAAAWALGRIGGPLAAQRLTARCRRLVAQGDAPAELATVAQALQAALDRDTIAELNPNAAFALREALAELLDAALNPATTDADLLTALGVNLARLAVRAPEDTPRGMPAALLKTGEPVATLAAVGVLLEAVSQAAGEAEGAPDAVASAFERMAAARGARYDDAERERLVAFAEQYAYAERDAEAAGQRALDALRATI
jgi:hypothetical protein